MRHYRKKFDQRCWACGQLVRITVQMAVPTSSGLRYRVVCTTCAATAARGEVLSKRVVHR